MPSFLVLRIHLLLLLSGDDDGVGWIRFLHDGSVEDEDDNYGFSNFLGITTWRLSFSNNDIKMEMMLPLWNNLLRSLLRSVVIRSDHDEGPGIISFRYSLVAERG
jgi:hypothetical protein